jgi:hypothetical protein
MKAYGAVDIQIHVFLISALDGGEWSASRPACSKTKVSNTGGEAGRRRDGTVSKKSAGFSAKYNIKTIYIFTFL